MHMNRTSVWKVLSILVSRELPVFYFERLEFMMPLNRTSAWKVMTILISRYLLLFNFERLNMWSSWIGPSCDNLWPLEFLESFHCSISSVSIYYVPESDIRVKSYDNFSFSRASVVQFRASRYIMCLNRPPSEQLWPFELLNSFHCSISSVSRYYTPESDLWMKIYDHFNFSRAFVVQFRASRYIIRLNRTSEWKVMTIWISQELPLFNFERLDILCAWIEPPS